MPRGSYVESQAPSEGSGSYVEPQDQEGLRLGGSYYEVSGTVWLCLGGLALSRGSSFA